MKGPAIARLAKEQLAELTGLTPDTVSKLVKASEGWQVDIEMIEMRRIPNSNDVLATYQVQLDEKGNLVSYERIHRYYRGQVSE